ncbi:MAG: penicillin-binding protein 2, partial [Desulfobacterota bacterium]|nr:penicillin-binding protein 2 [Thermodesulfobacteriota bacterium]
MNKPKWIRCRVLILFSFFSFALISVAIRGYQLQILKQPELVHRAEIQRKHLVKLWPTRGIIYDRKKRELAGSVEVDSVFAHPWQVEDPLKTAEKLSNILSLKTPILQKILQSNSPFVWITRGISPAKREQIEALNLKGIHFLKENKRFYPHCEIAGQLLGFVGIDGNGLEGLELSYENSINGGNQVILVERDAIGRQIVYSGILASESPGNNLVLTIDLNIQYILERELRKAVEKFDAHSGIGIIMNPRTGEILALAIQPSFNPNNFNNYSPQHWKNRALTDNFEPGSTFKVFLAASALEEKLVSPEEIFYCENGTYRIGRRTIHDVHKYGNLTFAEIIKFSSNIGATKVCERMSKETFYNYIRKFGFGEKTGVDLPFESPGAVRPYQRWREIEKSNIAFGQGIGITALQLINALNVIANGGYLMRPFIVKKIINPKGEILKNNSPLVIRKVISKQTARSLTEIMIGVTLEGGTGRAAFIPGFEVAGKTGTAQKVDHQTRRYTWNRPVGSFMGFVPARNPQISILIVIDEPKGRGFGGTVAAPVFRAVAEEVLKYLNIFPEPKLLPAVASTETSFPFPMS